MRVIAFAMLRDFSDSHADAKQALLSWYHEFKRRKWEHPAELKNDYPTVSILANNRLVFNIKGNHYRLVVKLNFNYQVCYVRFVGTHAEYDKIDAARI